jgi:hypothetical protein
VAGFFHRITKKEPCHSGRASPAALRGIFWVNGVTGNKSLGFAACFVFQPEDSFRMTKEESLTLVSRSLTT